MSLFQDLNLVSRNNPPIVDAFFGRLEFSGSLVRSSKGCGCMLDRSGNSSNSSIWRCFEFRETLGRRTPGLTGSLLDLPFERRIFMSHLSCGQFVLVVKTVSAPLLWFLPWQLDYMFFSASCRCCSCLLLSDSFVKLKYCKVWKCKVTVRVTFQNTVSCFVSLELTSRSGWIVLLPRGNVAPPVNDRLDGAGKK